LQHGGYSAHNKKLQEKNMGTTTMGVKLDDATRERLKAAAASRLTAHHTG
jgi:hypothetical protein